MKDIVFTRARQRRELIIFGVCVVVAFILNICAIASYDAPWSELYSAIFYVLIFAAVLYAVTIGIRLLVYGVRLLFPRKTCN